MSSINDRIKSIMSDYKLSSNDFSDRIQGNKGTLNNIIGGRKSSPSYELINKIAVSFPEIDVNWLITGRGSMYVNDIGVNDYEHIKEPERKAYRLRTDRNIKEQDVPLYNIEATAGIVGLFNDSKSNEPVDYISVPNLPKCDGAVYVTGDSMYPLLKSGDIVMYKQHNLSDGIIWGEMYLINYDHAGDDITAVKYIKKSEVSKEYIKLVSQNQHHQDRDIELAKVRALALVKASIRINTMM